MPIYQTAHYQVRPEAVPAVAGAIREFIHYVTQSEPGSLMYSAWPQFDDPTKFVHLFIFTDEAAHQAHGRSEAVRHFESVYQPDLRHLALTSQHPRKSASSAWEDAAA